MNVLTVAGIDINYQSCINNANKETINFFQQIKDEEEKIKNDKYQKNNNATSGTTYQKLAKEMINIASKEIGTKEGGTEEEWTI